MKTRMLLLLFLAVLALDAAPALRISKTNPVSIGLPENALDTEKEAARDLQETIGKICGAQCRIVPEKDITGPAILVGDTDFAKKNIPNLAALESEQWAMKTVDGNLILCGGKPRGTLYAAYEFLEKLGVVWPNAVTTHIPKMDEVAIEPMDILDKPALALRRIYTGINGGSPDYQAFQAHNKMNCDVGLPANKGGVLHSGRPGGCHTFHAYSKPEWPDEWFTLNKDGKRIRSTSGSGPGHLCLTNPDLQKAMAARLREFIEADRKGKPREQWPVIYDVSHNDTANPCLCETCKRRAEEEGGYSGPMLDLINYMANDIAADYPDVLVQTFAYTWTLDAPKHIRPAKNVVIRICKLGCEFRSDGKADTLSDNQHPRNKDFLDNFMKWSKMASHLVVWDYWKIYTKCYDVPYLNARNFCKDIAFYADNKVLGMFVESESAPTSSFFHFKFWLGLKAMQNPHLDYNEMADRFCRAAYGPAAKPMRQYMEYLQDRREAADKPVALEDNILMRPFLGTKMDFPDPTAYLDHDFFVQANAFLDQAQELAAENPVYLANVMRERLPVDNTLKYTYAKYVDNPPSGRLIPKTYQALYARCDDVMKAQIHYFFEHPYKNKELFDIRMTQLDMERQLAFASETILPKELNGRKTFVIAWPGIKNLGLEKPVKDTEAFTGLTCNLKPRNTPDYHRLPYSMELYTYRDKKTLQRFKLEEKDIPQDEKYHLYHVGRCDITPRTLVALHWTWLLQAYIDSVYLPDADNNWDVYVSLKLTGEPYVKGSKSEVGVFCDKVILAK